MLENFVLHKFEIAAAASFKPICKTCGPWTFIRRLKTNISHEQKHKKIGHFLTSYQAHFQSSSTL